MASGLEAALAWARRGFRVFPVQAGGRLPACDGWTVSATADPDALRAAFTDPVTSAERDLNFGVLTTELVVLDVDVKDGKPGLATLLGLGLEPWSTLSVRTPSGGWHLFFKGIGREVGQSPLGPGLDVRSKNGYVVGPGSTISGVPYVLEHDVPLAEFPHELRPLLKPPRSRRGADGVSVELDRPEALEVAAHWLRREAPAAVQGMNGDDCAYRVACRVRDLGASEEAALDLMLEEWNARCEPPWSPEELRVKVENAYQYATGAAGSLSADAAFDHVVSVPPPRANGCASAHLFVPATPAAVIRFGNMLEESAIMKRAWVIEGVLMEETTSLLVAPSGAGKSLLSLIVAAHLATGAPLWGMPVVKPGRSIIYNAEDDLAEVSRRMIAVCREYGLDERAVADRVCLLGRDDVRLKLTQKVPPEVHREHVAVLVEAASDPEVVMLSVDPLISLHTARENDVTEMEFVMDVMRDVSRRASVPILCVQHTGKPSAQASGAGDQYASRGSTAVPAAARVVLTLYPATERECVEVGAPVADRKKYVRLDGAKVSYGEAPGEPRWLRWTSRVVAEDRVGVLVEHDARGARRAEADRLGVILADWLLDGGEAARTLGAAASHVIALTPPTETPEAHAALVRRLGTLLAVPLRTARGSVTLHGSGARGTLVLG